MNQKDESFKNFIPDQLRDLDNLEARRMFGGFGLYQDEMFFGIVHKQFKVSARKAWLGVRAWAGFWVDAVRTRRKIDIK